MSEPVFLDRSRGIWKRAGLPAESATTSAEACRLATAMAGARSTARGDGMKPAAGISVAARFWDGRRGGSTRGAPVPIASTGR